VTGRVAVTVLDNDTAGVIVSQPNGPMVISADGTLTASYTVRLTSAPTSDVTITPVNDGLTDGIAVHAALHFDKLVEGADGQRDGRGRAGGLAAAASGHETIRRAAHLLTSLHGPFEIDGGLGTDPHPLVNAVLMPAETNAPVFKIATPPPESTQIDVLNVYDDSSQEDKIGTLTGAQLTGFGMAVDLTFAHTAFGENNFIPGGITYRHGQSDGTTLQQHRGLQPADGPGQRSSGHHQHVAYDGRAGRPHGDPGRR